MLQEAVKNNPSITYFLVNTVAVEPKMKIDQVLDINQISTLTKLLRVTALVLQFVRKFKNKVRDGKKTENWKSLGASDLNEAEKMWIKVSKPRHFLKKAIFSRTEASIQNPPLTSRSLNCSWRTISSSVKENQ